MGSEKRMKKEEIDYRWCWFQLRHRADGEHNKMMDIIEDAL